MQTWSRRSANDQTEYEMKGDFSDFEHGMVVGVRGWFEYFWNYWTLLGFSWRNHHLRMLWRRENICLIDAGGQRRVVRLLWAGGKATVTQAMVATKLCRRASLDAQYVEPWSRWATASKEHTGWHSCQAHENWTLKKRENTVWSHEYWFLLFWL